MKATWLMALVSYAATVLTIWWICMQRVLHGVTLQGMELANWGIAHIFTNGVKAILSYLEIIHSYQVKKKILILITYYIVINTPITITIS